MIQGQRDGLLRLRERLLATIRDLERENDALRSRLAAEREEARELERELAIEFHLMPDTVYPGRPYVMQQELIQRGITGYTRQNISRLARDGQIVPAVVIADRVLLPPAAVRALLERERAASRDPSPRRRPRAARRRTSSQDR